MITITDTWRVGKRYRVEMTIGADSGGFGYDLDLVEIDGGITVTAVRWSGVVDGTAREILAKAEAPPDDPADQSELEKAKRFLLNILGNGDLPAKQVRADCEGAGYSWRTVQRAQNALGLEPYKKGMKEGWFWTLEGRRTPKTNEDRHKKEWQTSGDVGVLRETAADATFTDHVINYRLSDRDGLGIVLPEPGETIEEATAKLRERFGDRITFVRPGDTAEGSL